MVSPLFLFVGTIWPLFYRRPGRLFQVEYAMEAINNAAAAVGLLTEGGIVLAAEKRVRACLPF